MLDKNPDTRITLSEIKVASEQTQARQGHGSLAGKSVVTSARVSPRLAEDSDLDDTTAVKITGLLLKNLYKVILKQG